MPNVITEENPRGKYTLRYQQREQFTTLQDKAEEFLA